MLVHKDSKYNQMVESMLGLDKNRINALTQRKQISAYEEINRLTVNFINTIQVFYSVNFTGLIHVRSG